MAERKVGWKPRSENTLIGKRIARIDGIEKASGAAKYSADINTKGTLFARLLVCTRPNAEITKLNVKPAEAIPGVRAVHILKDVGKVCQYDGEIIAGVAADRIEIAEEAVRAIEVAYKDLPFFVDEADVESAKALDKQNVDKEGDLTDDAVAQGQMIRTKDFGEQTQGDVEEAIKNAAVVHKGHYGIVTISHCCLEPHGSHCEFTPDGKLDVHLSTQNVSGTAGGFASAMQMDESKVSMTCNYIGGGFGSKFSPGEWGLLCAELARKAGKPVRLMLDRATELKSAGTRPSGFADVTIAADQQGTIVAWDSYHWGSSGMGGGIVAINQYPYVFDFPSRRRRATGLITNCGPNQAWRAPPHPQLCALTHPAIDDIAAKLGLDSYDVFMRNLDKTKKADVYAEEMKIAARLIDWKAKWHPHGKGAEKSSKKTGLGMAIHQWGGAAHAANCTLKVHPDGTVETSLGSQDLGTGTRTIIAVTIAETFGLPVEAVKVNLGWNGYPQAGGSGGSTTVGGVSGPIRRASLEALWKICDLVAAKYSVDANTLSAKDQKILSGDKEVCTWKQAASLIGVMPLEVKGEGPKNDGLTDQGVGGVQMADVTVDTETGVVRINKLVCVQDCGLIIDLLTAESQVYGGLIMGISYSLTEERIMDNKTGRYINADMENYKLPRIGDIGELIVEMYQPDSEYNRGVVGLGEPPVIATGGAISNAVANAIGVRVPVLPLTPKRVLDALKGGAV